MSYVELIVRIKRWIFDSIYDFNNGLLRSFGIRFIQCSIINRSLSFSFDCSKSKLRLYLGRNIFKLLWYKIDPYQDEIESNFTFSIEWKDMHVVYSSHKTQV